VSSALAGRGPARHRVEFVTVDSEPATGAALDGGDLVLRGWRDGAGWRYATTAVSTFSTSRSTGCIGLYQPPSVTSGIRPRP